MGACNSHSSIAVNVAQLNRFSSPTASVISISGDLRHFPSTVTARQVAESEPSPSFICNSDALVYEEFIPSLDPEDVLLPGNLYFILPKPKLYHHLTASDMAALALRASLALQKEESKKPSVRLVHYNISNNHQSCMHRDNEMTIGGSGLRKSKNLLECNTSAKATTVTYTRSGSVRKFQRMPSKRVKATVRSSRVKRLSTIYEGSEP